MLSPNTATALRVAFFGASLPLAACHHATPSPLETSRSETHPPAPRPTPLPRTDPEPREAAAPVPAPRTWNPSERLASDPVRGCEASALGMDDAGNAVVLVRSEAELAVFRRDAAAARWSEPVRIGGGQPRVFPKLSVAPNGMAAALWGEGKKGLVVARWDIAAAAWSSPEPVTPPRGVGSVTDAEVATNPRGDVAAVWERRRGNDISVLGNRYLAATGLWSGPLPLETGGAWARYPILTLDDAGHAVAIWTGYPGDSISTVSARLDVASEQWEALGDLVPAADPVAEGFFGGSGEVLVLWGLGTPPPKRLFGSLYDPSTRRWVAAHDFGLRPAYGGVAAFDPAGGILEVAYSIEDEHLALYAIRFDPSTSKWSDPERIAVGEARYPTRMHLGTDGSGNTLLVWVEADQDEASFFSLRYDGAGVWSSVEFLETVPIGHMLWSSFAMSRSGAAILAWDSATRTCPRANVRVFE